MTQWNEPQGRDPRFEQPTAQYGREQPGQPPYGAQPGRRGPQGPNPFGTEGNEQFGIVGMVLGLLGGVVLIVSFTALDWYKGSNSSFSGVHDRLNGAGDAAKGFAAAYFSWFAWTFLIVSVLAAVGSSFPSPALRAARVIGVVTAFAAAGLSFLAVQLADQPSYLDYLKNARIGFYLAVIGFVLVGIGAAIGPRKV
ncbi:MAG: hypothetical protein ACR2LX_01170 [Jatrophihabitans sp.]